MTMTTAKASAADTQWPELEGNRNRLVVYQKRCYDAIKMVVGRLEIHRDGNGYSVKDFYFQWNHKETWLPGWHGPEKIAFELMNSHAHWACQLSREGVENPGHELRTAIQDICKTILHHRVSRA